MLKNILLSGLMCSLLSAENFNEFLDKAIAHSPYLQSSALNIEQTRQEGSALTRYANPSVQLEYSRFDSDIEDRNNGYRVNLNQPIRLWGVGKDKEKFSFSMQKSAKAEFSLKRAAFIRSISLAYTKYAGQKMLLGLGDEELEIAKTIYDISKARYDSGTISRGVMLQAQVAYEMIEISNKTLVLTREQSYYALLKFAGINETIDIETPYAFLLRKHQSQNPKILSITAQKEQALNQAKVNASSIEWASIFAEFESEPEQDITRFGLNIPLAVFNTKSEEYAISKLEASQSELLLENEKTVLSIELKRLDSQRKRLQSLQKQNQKILKTELELLKMFQEGYKIANINLLELQSVKNKVITTKESLIQIQTALDQNTINTNYLQGSFND